MSPYDDWKTSGPHDDMPSVERTACDLCSEPIAWESEDGDRLCEEHGMEYLRDRLAKAESGVALLDEALEKLGVAS